MWDFLHLSIQHLTTSQPSTSSISTTNSNSSSRRSSLSSSQSEFRAIHSEIIRRHLITDFLEATSLPVNVPIHRSREASRPSTPMREEYDRCPRQLPLSLANKLYNPPPLPCEESAEEDLGSEEEEEWRRRFRGRSKKRRKSNPETKSDLMFIMEI